MLPPEPPVLVARQAFADAQPAMVSAPHSLGFFDVGWYGTEVDDDRGSFAVVSAQGPLASFVGNYLNVKVRGRDVWVYVIGSKTNLDSALIMTRRAYLAIELLAVDPTFARVALAQ